MEVIIHARKVTNYVPRLSAAQSGAVEHVVLETEVTASIDDGHGELVKDGIEAANKVLKGVEIKKD